MNISTKGRYGLRALVDLALNYQGRPVTLSQIALRQQLSEGYLEQLMVPLKRSGIVGSSRGAQGGYFLARQPEEIIVGEIFRALEGPLALASCVAENQSETCLRQGQCSSQFIWDEVQKAVGGVLDKYTLADLLAMETNKEMTF